MTVKATIRNGHLELDEPLRLSEGTEVEITIPDCDDEPETPEEIARAVALMDQLEPVQMTDEELDAWEADRAARRERSKATFFERAEKLRKMWE